MLMAIEKVIDIKKEKKWELRIKKRSQTWITFSGMNSISRVTPKTVFI
jgi:hypothetical protein